MLYLFEYDVYTLDECCSGFLPVLGPHPGLSHIFQDVADVVVHKFQELEGLVILKDSLVVVANEVIIGAVFEEFIDNFDLIVDVGDIFGSMVLRDFYIDLSFADVSTACIELVQLFISAIEEGVHNTNHGYCCQEYCYYEWNQQLL